MCNSGSAALLALAGGALAKTTGVADDTGLQSGPCYEALVDKNETNPTTARPSATTSSSRVSTSTRKLWCD